MVAGVVDTPARVVTQRMTRRVIGAWLVFGLCVTLQAQTVQWAQPASTVADALSMTYIDATSGLPITSVVCGIGPRAEVQICAGVRPLVTPDAKVTRSMTVRDTFRRLSGHPDGWPGHVVDHVVPLCAGGADAVENLQWQSDVQGKIKDKQEVALCAQLRRWRKAAGRP